MDDKVNKAEPNAEPGESNSVNVPRTSENINEEFLAVEGSASSPEASIGRASTTMSAAKSISFIINKEEKFKVDDIIVRCQICGKYQKNVSLLKFHMKHIHNSKDDSTEFKCPFCTTKFSTKKYRNEHMLMIHLLDKRKDLKCEICNKRFTSVDNKNDHVFKHHSKSKLPHNFNLCN